LANSTFDPDDVLAPPDAEKAALPAGRRKAPPDDKLREAGYGSARFDKAKADTFDNLR
jgi:hypothetical protein